MENSSIIDIEFWRLISAYLFVLLLIIIFKVRGIAREKKLTIAAFRMTLQLVIAGYVLTCLFEFSNPLLTLGVILIMEGFAIYTIYKQAGTRLSVNLKKTIAISMIAGTSFCLVFFNFVVIHFEPWYDPRYFIPIAGMIIGNSMTGITLSVKELLNSFTTQKDMIEGALMLGADPKAAVKPYVNHAFDSAVLPTINNMLGMGIIFLPGMMTGQILSGVSPLLAIEYQIVILLGILGSVGLSVILFILLAHRNFFNLDAQFFPGGKN
ncbi:ABC transporter permease [Cytobacillus oceanisediminis]|uniref:ABC transporter permease n=1 Tax=Cytobacillus TaxID=2675230 RepID=UPI0020413657|nr:iron export ABC transporter permease subunit FetB [Cytobacillus oceanisediminis]MCM3241635.1 iron export ABC transporter permease subunit FetB [Cytobacillus oceanisediminis]MCM3400563.1 iron export ABC transporter permease subunit FetB [Cytobacillus oceanisediminis]MDK7664831.1 iron export ABC transporter permease subunit FetB [Cytobacillus oceanisediminis]